LTLNGSVLKDSHKFTVSADITVYVFDLANNTWFVQTAEDSARDKDSASLAVSEYRLAEGPEASSLEMNMKGITILDMALLSSCLLLFSGCATQKETMIKEGYPLGYAEGFDDGCHSGKQAGGSMFDQFKKDVKRFEADTQYAQGWSDGFRQCESEQEAIERQTRMAMEQQKLIEQRKKNELQEQYHLESEALKGVDTSGLKNLK
jgi:hypothetical protein